MPVAIRSPRLLLARLASLAGPGLVLSYGLVAMMELLLQHDGYGWRFVVDAAIVAEGALTIAVFEDLIDLPTGRWPLVTAAAATGLLSWWIIAAASRVQVCRRGPTSKAPC